MTCAHRIEGQIMAFTSGNSQASSFDHPQRRIGAWKEPCMALQERFLLAQDHVIIGKQYHHCVNISLTKAVSTRRGDNGALQHTCPL